MALSLRDFLASVGPDLFRIKDEVDPIDAYTRVKPKGSDDPALQDLLARLGAMAR